MSANSHSSLAKVFNIPNQLTTLRLLLAVVLFAFIVWEYYLVSMALFIVAAGTDWLDGYWARKYGQVTTLGRMLDPFADKVIICGTFTFLVAIPAMQAVPWGLRAWMVVVIVGRELLITALRSFMEQQGSDFSAKMVGKLKMVLQCVAAGFCLYYLSYRDLSQSPLAVPGAPAWVWLGMVATVWGSVVLTAYSGVTYVLSAVRLLRQM
ncbi:MAG: CDP-diacylglycerol--glycerol-3-phosphate 3-phosphatidyltransferase [Patescibacteria group bacterium]|nr:CDP-diacylglycerol--glycerol-3-phosphate 3-phosphatidyltransferase [Patescibacteria group bacterium]